MHILFLFVCTTETNSVCVLALLSELVVYLYPQLGRAGCVVVSVVDLRPQLDRAGLFNSLCNSTS